MACEEKDQSFPVGALAVFAHASRAAPPASVPKIQISCDLDFTAKNKILWLYESFRITASARSLFRSV